MCVTILSRIIASIAVLLALLCAAVPCLAGTVSVQASLVDHHPFGGAVITVHGRASHAPVAPVSAILDQINLAFVPDLIVIPVGSTVDVFQIEGATALVHPRE